jgi:ATP-dependent RNA helicase DDX23/PRP28
MNGRKFIFDWDTQDDTLVGDSLIAAGINRQGAQVMFGRGHLAGIDDGDPIKRRKTLTPGVGESPRNPYWR